MVVKKSKDIMDTNWYWQTPVYSIMKPEWLNPAIKATDKHIKESQENKKPELCSVLFKSFMTNFAEDKDNSLYLFSLVIS